MNNRKRMLAGLVLLAVSCTAGASDIYKRVNNDGVAEYSDKPFPGATQVSVDPNVIATNPVQHRARPAAAADAGEETAASRSVSLETDTQTTDYVRARTRREERAEAQRRESRNYRNTRDEEMTDSNPGRATRNAVRNAATPGPR